jgi:hypothetical protein
LNYRLMNYRIYALLSIWRSDWVLNRDLLDFSLFCVISRKFFDRNFVNRFVLFRSRSVPVFPADFEFCSESCFFFFFFHISIPPFFFISSNLSRNIFGCNVVPVVSCLICVDFCRWNYPFSPFLIHCRIWLLKVH